MRGANAHLRPNAGVTDDELRGRGLRDEGANAVAAAFGLSPSEVVRISDAGTSHCHSVGLECAQEAPHSIEKVIHVPTGIELLEVERFGDRVVHQFEVQSIVFGAPLPDRLTD